jgi:signal peptidase I
MAVDMMTSGDPDVRNMPNEGKKNSVGHLLVSSEAQLNESVGDTKILAPVKPKPLGKRIVSILCNVALVFACLLLVVSTVIFALSRNPKEVNFGYQFYSVLTGSMAPQVSGKADGFSAGDMILIKRCGPAEIAVGDIATFATDQEGSAYLTHRVVKVMTEFDQKPGTWFVTRGDVNNSDDPPVPGDLLVGKKIFVIPMLGGILQQIQQNIVVVTVFVVSALGFIIAIRYCFAKPAPKLMEQEADEPMPTTLTDSERTSPHTYIHN